jgi:multidrug efflux pump subunit AcrA (membrane-fusion protein)
MSDGVLLAQLIGQAAGEGADLVTLRAIAEEAGELGAARALARLGLDDAAASKDMAELRELLAAWRDAKKSAVKAAVAWVVRLALALVLVGLAVKLGFSGFIK